jgi:hypothetical protein
MIEKVQIKYDGRLREIPVAELDMDPATATDSEVLHAVAQTLGVDSLSEHQVEPPQDHIDRQSVTVLNVRPTAVFG